MRSILRNAPKNNQFSTSKLSQVIKQTSQNLKQQQNINYLKYEQIFFKLYTTHIMRQKRLNLNVKKIDALCMMSDFPCKSIVQHFHATAKSYSQQYTVQTFIRLSRAYKISQSDNASSADYSINRLFYTPAFQNLIQQYKFGLKKQNAMTWDNMFLVAQCLIDIGYADYQVFSILLNLVQTRLNKQQRNQIEIRNFQIEKKSYYLAKHRHTQSNLTNDDEFIAVLKMLGQKVKSHEITQHRYESLNQLKSELSSSEQSQNLYHSILESVNLIQSYNKDLTKLIEGIFTIRKQYRKMTKLSQTKTILRNPQFNLQLLELEEMLLVKKLISLSDIKSPQKIDNDDIQIRRTEEILISMIQPQGSQISVSNNEIGDLIHTNFSQGSNKQSQRLQKLRQNSQYGRGMSVLSRFAQLSRRLYNSPDNRSLISMKWQKTLLLWHKSQQQTSQWRQNLHVQKIFRRAYTDLYRMMKRSYSIFGFTFIEASLKYKIQFFESLTRLGFHEQVIHVFENQDTSKEKVQNYNNAEFFSLIKVLNEIGAKINADHLKKAALKHLKKVYEDSQFEQNQSLFTIEFTTNAVNFICQNFNVLSVDMIKAVQHKDQVQVLYQNLIDRLAQQAKYFDQSVNFLSNDHLYQALRVLSLERPGQFKLTNDFYKRFGINTDDKKQLKEFLYRKNPFNSIVQELCQKYSNSPLKGHYPFMKTGFNTKGDLTAVLLCSSDQSSMNGKSINGNASAYIQRVKREFNIIITPLCVNSFLEIDYEKLFDSKQFTFKSKQQISHILSVLFKRDQLHLLKFSQIISNIALNLQKHYKKSYLYAVVKFLNTLNQSVQLFDKQKQIMSFQLFRFRRYRLFVQLDSLKQDYSLLDKSVREQIQKIWKKQTSTHSQQIFRKSYNIIAMIDSIQHAIMNSVDNKGKEEQPFTKSLFQGKRFSIQTFLQTQSNRHNIGIEFINPTTYVDKTYCPYNDWAKVLAQEYPLETIKVKQSSDITKILAKRFLVNANQQLTTLPYAKRSGLREKKLFSFNSLEPVKNISEEGVEHNENNHKISQQQLEEIRQLMSFVHQLKLSKTEEQLIEYLFSFDFISNLGLKQEKSHASFEPLPRQHQAYFNYLESRNNKIYVESPNLDYLLSKLDQRQQIFQAMQGRKHKKAQIKIQYQLGNISRKQYYQKSQSIDNQIISKIQGLQKNVIDSVEKYQFLESGLKMIKIQQDQKQIQRVLNRARYYERILDKDFIHVRGNIDRCLKIKRQRAEKILALYKVLYKLAQNDSKLTDNEIQVLKRQTALITFRLDGKKQHLDSFSEKFTNLRIGDLSKADKQRLSLGGCDLTSFKNLPVTDLILEFVNLLDPKVYENFQKSIVKKYYKTKHGIPEEIFTSSLNKQFSKLAHQEQRAMVNQHSQLDFYQMGLLNEMVQTLKTQSKTGKQRFAQFYDGFYQEIQQLNSAQGRVQLISEYLNQKEIQYSEGYNPKLVKQIKEREVKKLWNLLFKKPFDECNSESIRKTVDKICERIRLMGENSPPFFGLLVIKILEHPCTDILTKQNLISNIQFFKIPLKLDSQDIRTLGIASSQQETTTISTSGQVLQQMNLVSNKNFMENLNKKINMIV